MSDRQSDHPKWGRMEPAALRLNDRTPCPVHNVFTRFSNETNAEVQMVQLPRSFLAVKQGLYVWLLFQCVLDGPGTARLTVIVGNFLTRDKFKIATPKSSVF